MDRPRRKLYFCNVCTKAFSNNLHLLRHKALFHSDSRQECDTCGLPFRSIIQLRIHEQMHLLPFSCQICNLKFESRQLYNEHTVTHLDKWALECSSCGIPFRTSGAYQEHILEHSETPIFSCENCFKTFYHKYGLIQHKVVHEGKHPYECYVCSEEFQDLTKRFQHAAIKHLLWCSLCELAFLEEKHYKDHLSETHMPAFDDLNDVQSIVNEESSRTQIETGAVNLNCQDGEQFIFILSGLEKLPGILFLRNLIHLGGLPKFTSFIFHRWQSDPPVKLPETIPVAGRYHELSLFEILFILRRDSCKFVTLSDFPRNVNNVYPYDCIYDGIPEFSCISDEYDDFLLELVEECQVAAYPLNCPLENKLKLVLGQLLKFLCNPSRYKSGETVLLYYLKRFKTLSNFMGKSLRERNKIEEFQ